MLIALTAATVARHQTPQLVAIPLWGKARALVFLARQPSCPFFAARFVAGLIFACSHQARRTFSACGPFFPVTMSNVTESPSLI